MKWIRHPCPWVVFQRSTKLPRDWSKLGKSSGRPNTWLPLEELLAGHDDICLQSQSFGGGGKIITNLRPAWVRQRAPISGIQKQTQQPPLLLNPLKFVATDNDHPWPTDVAFKLRLDSNWSIWTRGVGVDGGLLLSVVWDEHPRKGLCDYWRGTATVNKTPHPKWNSFCKLPYLCTTTHGPRFHRHICCLPCWSAKESISQPLRSNL